MKQFRSGQKSAIAIAVSTILAGGSTAARAEEATDNNALEEVIVTAQGRRQTVLEVPYNISAVSGDTIAKAQITDTAELMRTLAGVSTVDRGYRNSGSINPIIIRGLNTNGSALGDYQLSAVPTVSTYVNNTPVFANFLMKDLERVEVLRGPQGTLYGSGSLGGTVRYITHAPELGTFSGSVSATLSSTEGSDSEGWSADATLNIPIGETAALRVTGSRIDLPGIVDYRNLYVLDSSGLPAAPGGVLSPVAQYTSKKDADTVEISFARATFLWRPSDKTDVTLTYAWQSDDVGGRRQDTQPLNGVGGVDGFGVPYKEYEQGALFLEPSSRDVNLVSLEANFDFGFATLTSSSSYYDHKGDIVADNSGFYAKAGFYASYYNFPRPNDIAIRSFGDQAFVQELRLASKTGGAFDYVAGMFYEDQDLASVANNYVLGFKRWYQARFPTTAGAVTTDNDFNYSRQQNYTEKAVYGELTWHPSGAVKVTGGLRYYDYRFKNDSILGLPAYTGLFPSTTQNFNNSDSGVLGKLNASWEFAGKQLLYATVSQGYRRGGANAVPTTGPFAENPAYRFYDSDSIINYEIGVKGVAANFTYSAAVFFDDWKDVQINIGTPVGGFFAAQNGGKAKTQGLEAEIDANPTDSLHLSIAYTYVKAELRNNVARLDNPTRLLALSGAPLPGTAQNTLSASAGYTNQLSNGMRWVTRVNGYYQSSTQNSVELSPRFNTRIDGFQIWGLSTSLGTDKWTATLYAKNLFAERGVTGAFTEVYAGTLPSVGFNGNNSRQFLSLPRTLGLTIDYRF